MLFLLSMSLCFIALFIFNPVDITDQLKTRSIWFAIGGCLGCVSLGTIWLGTNRFNAAKQIEQVAPITRHNTGQLPAVETLVRASDLPPSQQQAELLRAAQYGQGTPSEELLRASQTNRDNEC